MADSIAKDTDQASENLLTEASMTKSLEISVIIPSYNPDVDHLKECLQAIHSSIRQPLEVIVVDDGSPEDYSSKIEGLCTLIKNPLNVGSGFARNLGAKQAKGDILCFIDVDVIIRKDTLAEVVKNFKRDNIAAAQLLYSKETRAKNFLSQYQNYYQHFNFMRIKEKYLCTFSSYAMAIKRDVFFEAKGFAEYMKSASCEDEYLGLHVYARGEKILLTKDIRVEHLARFTLKKLLKRMFVMGREAAELHLKYGKRTRADLSKTHHHPSQAVSIFIAPIVLFLSALSIVFPAAGALTLGTAALFVLLNFKFLKFLYKEKGLLFSVRSLGTYYFICLASFSGAMRGGLNFLKQNRYLTYTRKISKVFNKHRILPEHVTFFITNKCNAKCGHCFYWKDLNVRVNEISLAEIERVSRTMGNFTFLLLTGGEPFLRKDIGEIAKIFYRNNNVRKMNIVTMGDKPERIASTIENVLEECPDYYITIYISIDDIEMKHDELRRVKGLYQRAVETRRLLGEVQRKYHTLSVGNAMVYTSANKDYIHDMYDKVKKDFMPDTVTCAYVRGDPKDPNLKTSSVDNYEILQQLIKNDLLESQIGGVKDPVIGKFIAAAKFTSIDMITKIARHNRYYSPCYAGKINAVIYPNADVVACEILNDKMGNLRDVDYDFKKIWFTDHSKEITDRIINTKCFCTHECNALPNIVFNPTFAGKIFKNFIRLCKTPKKTKSHS